jgi:Domain of unknown function (DUF1816)
MNSFPLNQTPLSWWVEVCTSGPSQTYHLGPFNSREEAKISRGAHVQALCQKEARGIFALIKQHQPGATTPLQPSARNS